MASTRLPHASIRLLLASIRLPPGCSWLPSGYHQALSGFCCNRLHLASTRLWWLHLSVCQQASLASTRLLLSANRLQVLSSEAKMQQKCSLYAAYMQQKCRLADKKPWSQNAASLKPTCSLFAANLQPRFLASKKMWVNMRWDLSYDSILSNVRKALIFGLIFT